MSIGREPVVDATPERLSKGDPSEFVDPAKIDSSEQRIGYVRQFKRVSRLDSWHRAEVITQRQWWAGVAYRNLHERAMTMPRVVASYGERTTGGETDYGMARTAAQARRRKAFREARSAIPTIDVGLVDRLLLHNGLPDFTGRKKMGVLKRIREGLDVLADHFEHRRADQSLDERNEILYGLPQLQGRA